MHVLFTDCHYSKYPYKLLLRTSTEWLIRKSWLMSFTPASFTATIIIVSYSFMNIINLYFITLIYEHYKIKIIVVPTDGILAFLLKMYLKTPKETLLGCFAAWVDCSIVILGLLIGSIFKGQESNNNTRKHASTPSQHLFIFDL